MHAAPPVRISVGSDLPWRGFVASSASVAAANLTAWLGVSALLPIAVSAAAAVLAAGSVAGLAWWAFRRRGHMAGVLVWDGDDWHWTPDAARPCQGELAVTIDLGAWLLLRFAPTVATEMRAPVVWLVASRRQAGSQWPAWRAALYSLRPRGDPPGALDPA